MGKAKFLIICAVALNGCATLTKTQISAVNQFAQTSKDFSAYPSKILKEVAEIKEQAGLYKARSLCNNPTEHINELSATFADSKKDQKITSSVDITFKIIDKYAQSLLLLSSDKFSDDLEKQAKNFGLDIDSLIAINNKIDGAAKLPTGIGSTISDLITLGGKQYIRSKQAREIKKFVPLADTLISVMTKNLLDFLNDKHINDLIEDNEKLLQENYKFYLIYYHQLNIPPPVQSEVEFLGLLKKIEAIKQLRSETIKATKSLSAAHRKMTEKIKEKKSLKEIVTELQIFYNDVLEIKNTLQSINKTKN